jgi:hypothetical protein
MQLLRACNAPALPATIERLQMLKAEKEIEAFQEQVLVASKERVQYQEVAELAKRQAAAAAAELQVERSRAAEGSAAAETQRARAGELAQQLAAATRDRIGAEQQAATLQQDVQHLQRDAAAMKVRCRGAPTQRSASQPVAPQAVAQCARLSSAASLHNLSDRQPAGATGSSHAGAGASPSRFPHAAAP